jgi:UPF0176 protein
MRRLSAVVPLLAMLVACGTTQGDPKQDASVEPAAPPAASGQARVDVPPEPKPAREAPCPYLTAAFVGEANGQRAAEVRISADKPYPACFFYRSDGGVQLTVRVFVGTPQQAKAIVDKAAPVDTSSPATSPSGWKGGSQTTDAGAVYAVAKEGYAVVVTTNQGQTIKARRVVEKAITALEL